MAHVQKRTLKGTTSYRARIRLHDGRERAKSFARKADAERWLHETQAELNRGNIVDPSSGRVTVREYAETWRSMQVHRHSTASVTKSRLDRRILPTFGHRRLASILPSEIQAWVKKLSVDYAPSTVEATYRLLATIFRSAVADRLIPSSPCIRIQLPRQDAGQVVPLSVEQVVAVREHMPERARAMVTVAAGVGLRRGEVLGLTVDRIDFLRRTITVDRQLVQTPGKGMQFGPPKTSASVRTVPAPVEVIQRLAHHIELNSIEHPWGLVFTNSRRREWSRSRFSDIWRTAADDAKLPEGTRFHDLRHHTASLLIAAGCSVKVVQHQLGHASATETLDTYSHLWPNDDQRVRDAIDDAYMIGSG